MWLISNLYFISCCRHNKALEPVAKAQWHTTFSACTHMFVHQVGKCASGATFWDPHWSGLWLGHVLMVVSGKFPRVKWKHACLVRSRPWTDISPFLSTSQVAKQIVRLCLILMGQGCLLFPLIHYSMYLPITIDIFEVIKETREPKVFLWAYWVYQN